MSKSILVIDTPKCCDMCRIYQTYPCRKWSYERIKTIPETCELKTIPEKIDENNCNNIYQKRYIEGWNDCIDKILKG